MWAWPSSNHLGRNGETYMELYRAAVPHVRDGVPWETLAQEETMEYGGNQHSNQTWIVGL